MKRFLTKRWMVVAVAVVLTLSIGGAAFAATGSSTDTSTAGDNTTATTATGQGAAGNGNGAPADAGRPWGHQRSDETLVTGDVAAKVQAAALAKVGSDATVMRVETDADGNAKYEVHLVKSDGTCVTVYVDESYNVVSVQEGGMGRGHGDGDGTCDGPRDDDGDGVVGGGHHRHGCDGTAGSDSASGSTSSTTGASSATY